MFKVEFFVDDKRLGGALNALVGLAHGQPAVQPVVNAIVTKNGMVPASNGGSMDRIRQALGRVKKGTVLNGAEFRELLKTAGIPYTSSSYFTRECEKKGLLKRAGKTSKSTYTVL